MPGLFRKPVKPSKSMFALAVVIAVGLSFEFVQGVWLEVNVNGRHVNFLTLPLYWLLWNVLPLTFFGIGKLLQKQGR
jgi:hypothetical protein